MINKICKICKEDKPVVEFPKAGTYKGLPSYRGECYTCNRIKQQSPEVRANEKKYKTSKKGRATRSLNRKRPEVRAKEQAAENRSYAAGPKKRQIINRINKKLEDPAFYGIWLLKNALRAWVKAKGERKNTKIGNYIGCNKNEFRAHIEAQFTSEMNWDNHATFWEYDHIVPISSAQTMDEAYKLTHYSNIRPLHWLENVRKSNKVI